MGLLDSIKKVGSSIVAPGSGSIPGMGDLTNVFGGSSVKELIPGIGDAMAQDKANKLNLNEAQTNRAFQERMSNTAYQRAMDDMKKAGLNPLLAYQQGGASTPSGGTATVQSATKTGLADMALKATTGIGGLQQQKTALEQQQAVNQSTITLNSANAAKSVADAQRTREETKGLGKKAAEGDLWSKMYKSLNGIIDNTAKRVKESEKRDGPLIKSHGKASEKEGSAMFKWLNKGLK